MPGSYGSNASLRVKQQTCWVTATPGRELLDDISPNSITLYNIPHLIGSTMKTKISVTRALVEIKRLDDRINKAIGGGVFIARTIGLNTNRKVVGVAETVAQTEARIQGSFDKVAALIANRAALKSALVLSNAQTLVTVLGTTMTVAEAIELKTTVSFRTTYMDRLKAQLFNYRELVERSNNALDAEIETSLNTLYGSDRSKVDSEAIKMVTEAKKNQKEQALLDPSKIEAKIEAVDAEILNLTSELDFVLSESNARTSVEVELAAA